ncbi:MAG: hypothetical protein R3E64_06285 [Halioglobus sp.]
MNNIDTRNLALGLLFDQTFWPEEGFGAVNATGSSDNKNGYTERRSRHSRQSAATHPRHIDSSIFSEEQHWKIPAAELFSDIG